MTKIKANGGWVLIRPDAEKEKTASGIIIPSSVTEYGHTLGTVLDARDMYATRDKGILTKMPVSKGDRVMYRDYLKGMEPVEVDGKPCCFIYIEDIVLVMEPIND
jgi:co-chaperonin GroES (HSP10)